MSEEEDKAKADADALAAAEADKAAKVEADKAAADKVPEQFTVTVDGTPMTFTKEEALKKVSESAGAQKKFEDASKMLKEAQPGLQLSGLMKELQGQKEPDPQKMEEFLGLLGVEGADATKLMEEMGIGSKEDDKGKDKGKGRKSVKMEDLDDRTRAAVEAAEQMDLENIRGKIDSEVKKGLDNDKILVKLIDSMPEDRQDKLRQVLSDMAIEDVRGRILAREGFGPEMIQSTLQKIRARVDDLGIPAVASGQAAAALGPTTATWGPEVHSTEPIKRLPTTDDKYEENAVSRFRQMFVNAMRKGGGK